jgi:hypothetical protein
MRTGPGPWPARAGLMLLAAMATGVSACGFVPSAYRMDLHKSAWSVTSLDGVEVTGPIAISFNDGDVDAIVTIASPCGAVQWSVDQDTDGDAIDIWGDTRPDGWCADAVRDEASAVLDSLVEVDAWRVRDDDHIILVGPSSSQPTIELIRIR